MPITINGSGTVTGLSVGGLPDGSINNADLASNAVSTSKILNGAVTIDKMGTNEGSGLAKAWVNFNGTGVVAIRASYNVSSITDNGVGDYTVNFTTALVDANYAATFGAKSLGVGSSGDSANLQEHPTVAGTTTAYRVVFWRSSTGNFIDRDNAYVAIFR